MKSEECIRVEVRRFNAVVTFLLSEMLLQLDMHLLSLHNQTIQGPEFCRIFMWRTLQSEVCPKVLMVTDRLSTQVKIE